MIADFTNNFLSWMGMRGQRIQTSKGMRIRGIPQSCDANQTKSINLHQGITPFQLSPNLGRPTTKAIPSWRNHVQIQWMRKLQEDLVMVLQNQQLQWQICGVQEQGKVLLMKDLISVRLNQTLVSKSYLMTSRKRLSPGVQILCAMYWGQTLSNY